MNIHKILFSKIVSTLQLDVFRILWSIVMFMHFAFLLFTPRGDLYYFNSIFHFRYPFFEWVPVLPDQYLKIIIVLGMISSVGLALGFLYKKSATILFLCYTYLFLIDVSYWNNHYYLFALFGLFFIFANFKGKFSLDTYLKKDNKINYAWQLNLFRLQIVIVYVFGAFSKLTNPEWMNFKSVRSIYTNRFLNLDIQMDEELFSYVVVFITIFGILFDLLVPFLLLVKNWKIKIVTFIVVISFHLSNIFLLEIGLFPYAMIASLILFLPFKYEETINLKAIPKKSLIKASLIVFFILQLILPLRHFFIKGNVFWTGEGKLYAWHMMSGSTEVLCKNFILIEKDDDGNILEINDLELKNFLNKKQIRTIGQLPFLAPQFFKFLKKEAELAGIQNPEIRGAVLVERNKKEYRYIISPKVNLCLLEYNLFKHDEWIKLYQDEFY